MWIPRTEEEIVGAVAAGLRETVTFDAKAELPAKGKSIAEDVAAMANEGGILLYGVGEDENKQLVTLCPIPLKGAGERVNNIVLTSLSPPPLIEIIPIPTATDASLGYLVVVIPLSANAPHMVTVDKDHRYYGRSELRNMLLSEGVVAQLYARRRVWERDLQALITTMVTQAPIAARADHGYLHIGSWPIGASPDMLARAAKQEPPANTLNELVQQAQAAAVFRDLGTQPTFGKPVPWRPQLDGWAAYLGWMPNGEASRGPSGVLDLWVCNDGSGRLFCGRAVEKAGPDLHFNDPKIAEITTRFIYLMGQLYQRAGFVGPVDLALAITGVAGAKSYTAQNVRGTGADPPRFELPEYRRTAPRIPAGRLAKEPRVIAEELIMPLVSVVRVREYNPFTENA